MQILTRFFSRTHAKHIEAVPHNMELVAHNIDNDPLNYVEEPALLYVGGETIGNIKVTFANGVIAVIPAYNWSQTFMVIKVWDTDTTEALKTNIRLYR